MTLPSGENAASDGDELLIHVMKARPQYIQLLE